ncbi:MAG: hypothetical protein IJQ07_03350 [Clostridia bacterium]|nr:hypothetical protein [Clostridia bacterium]
MWIKRRNLKNLKKRKNKTNKSHIYNPIENNYIKKTKSPTRKRDIEEVTVFAPENFSIINNPDELSKFFDEIKYYIKNHKDNKVTIYFDLSKIKDVTIDAIMYLLALIKNLQNIGLAKHTFRGNLPQNEIALEKFKESGFLDFVNSRVQKVNANANKITIRTGQSNDSKVLKEICDFVIEKANCTRKNTKFLYPLMAEMMYNTYEHAYDGKSYTIKNWYIYVECENNLIKTTFLDTGLGIPSTLRKRFKETLFGEQEGKLLESALNGEFRSKTKLAYRNNGLPTIKNYAIKKEILNLHLLSNKAYCFIDDDAKISAKEMKNKIMGTIFYWELDINGMRG